MCFRNMYAPNQPESLMDKRKRLMSKCICERSCGESRTDPDCPVCGPRLENLRFKIETRGKDLSNPTLDLTYEQLKLRLADACNLLRDCRSQFKYYEMNHREKMIDPKITKTKLLETFDKAEANAAFVKMIEAKLDELEAR